jgi:DNA-directed RNA polymerase I, II, and III subunit RPABC2
MSKLEGKSSDQFKIFIRNPEGKKKVIKNSAQELYIKADNQKGGKKKKELKSETDNENDLESSSESESESESELESESDSISVGVNDDGDNVAGDDAADDAEEDDDINEMESETVSDEEPEANDTGFQDYNEDGEYEKETESDNDENIVEKCLYQFDDMIDEKITDKEYEIPSDKRKTGAFLTHYEKIRILGIRTKQIIMGAKPMIKYDEGISAFEIAKQELNNMTTPLIIKRLLPNNSYELWKINELNNDIDYDKIMNMINDSFNGKSNFI